MSPRAAVPLSAAAAGSRLDVVLLLAAATVCGGVGALAAIQLNPFGLAAPAPAPRIAADVVDGTIVAAGDTATPLVICHVTAPSAAVAATIADRLVASRAAACVQRIGAATALPPTRNGSGVNAAAAESGVASSLATDSGAAGVVHSTYWWDGKVETARSEVLLLVKTARRRVPAVRRVLAAHHPDRVPQLVCAPVAAASVAYLDWAVAAVDGS